MLGWRSSGFRPVPSAGGAASGANGDSRNTSSAAEERAEAEQHGGRVRRHLAQPPAREEQDRAAPQRQQQHPQQQRALLRGPRRGQPVEERRRRRRVARRRARSEKSERRNASLEDAKATDEQPGQRVDGAAAGGDQVAPAGARAVQRGADAVEADGQREDQAGAAGGAPRLRLRCFGSAVNFEGHFVTSESRSPTKTRALLAHVDHDLAPLAERVRAPGPVAHAARRRRPSRSWTRNVWTVPSCVPAALRDLAGQLVGLARLGGRRAGSAGAPRSPRRSSCRRARPRAAARSVSATTSRVVRLRDGSIALQYGDWRRESRRPIRPGRKAG